MQITRKQVAKLTMLGALALSPLAMAQSAAGTPSAASKQDTAFVAKASAAGMTEIQASKLADTHAQSAAVKSFAAKMVTDHTQAGDALSALAQKDGFTPSTSPMPA